MQESGQLNALRVKRLAEPGRYHDGAGLYLQVSATGAKSWLLRYMLNRKQHWHGLGSFKGLSLADARAKASAKRRLLADRIDPIEAKRNEHTERARRITFKRAAERFIAAKESGWRNEKHKAQWKASLASYAYPVIGELAVPDIATADVLRVIEPLWGQKRETARRLRGRIEQVIDACIARGERAAANPADWKRLRHLVADGRKIVRHHPALPYVEIAVFMGELREREGVSARALELLILTAARTGEVIGARWREIDTATKVWTVPAERMKGARAHRVPLSATALKLLAGKPRDSEFVFSSVDGAPLSNMAMLELMKGMRPGYVPHGFRSTFRDWAAETTAYPNHVVEAALAHAISDKVEAAYRRGDLFEKRRRLMDAWAEYCERMQAGKIMQLRARS